MILSGKDVPAGKVCHTNVNLVDLYPTFLEGLGVSPTATEQALPGRSLFALAAARDDDDRFGFSEYHALGSPSAAYMLTRGRYKYHHYVGYRPELFDLSADPDELHDLAAEPSMQPVLQAFERELSARLDPEAVDRRAKDDQNAIVARLGGPEAVRTLGNQGSTATPDKYLMA